MTIYSHSRLRTFEHCPLKFKFRYIDKLPAEAMSIESFLGKITHESLEWLYTEVKKNNLPTISELINYYSEKWAEKYEPEILIVRKDFTTKDYFNKGVEFLLNYYMKHKPFDDNTLEIEKRIEIDLNGDGKFKLQGFIDRLSHNLKNNEYEIHDYKTANSLPTRDKIENDKQLALYSIAIRELIEENKKIALIWHYLAHNIKIVSRRTSQQIEQLRQETIELIKKIESTTEFPSRKTILCNWCEYKSICSEFRKKDKSLGIWS